MAQFDDTHIEQPNRNHSGLVMKNSVMEQHIALDGNSSTVKDLAGAAHRLPNKMPGGAVLQYGCKEGRGQLLLQLAQIFHARQKSPQSPLEIP